MHGHWNGSAWCWNQEEAVAAPRRSALSGGSSFRFVPRRNDFDKAVVMNEAAAASLQPRTAVRETLVSADQFREGMRQFASGVALIASSHEGRPVGLAATAVNSVSADPPSLLICVNRSASAHEGIRHSRAFSVNLLAVEDAHMVEIFGSSARRSERFTDGDWHMTTAGVPLFRGALATFVCRVAERVEVASHSIFIGEVVAMPAQAAPRDPLIYFDRGVRALEKADV
ncbi:flavin reductase family protein [Streptomyces sp. NPDC001833]|uniref:flavin reductase family protein n=1 Tax=Streptomyces sp. NPDC001833 TaxID=3154658 RepID=UPI00332AAEB6